MGPLKDSSTRLNRILEVQSIGKMKRRGIYIYIYFLYLVINSNWTFIFIFLVVNLCVGFIKLWERILFLFGC
jgi:hypothetical protein